MADLNRSSTLLNAIRGEATELYQARIPLATQLNIADVGAKIYEYSSTRNEFEEALFNKVGKTFLNIADFSNPLAVLKKGRLEFGDTVEEIFIDLIVAQGYDVKKAETEIWKRVKPIILASFHKINRTDFYKTTVQRDELRKAFNSPDGLEKTLTGIVSRLQVSNQLDEFEIMKSLINTTGTAGHLHIKVIANPVSEATARQAVTAIKEVSNNYMFLKPDFNFAGVKNSAGKDRQVLLINTAFQALIDVEVLAYAFNMSKADFENSRQIIVDDFGGLENVVAMVMDERWFQVYENVFEMENDYNKQGRYFNYWLHVWQVYGYSPFANATIFVTVAPTLASIDVLRTDGKTTYSAGEAFQLEVIATGSDDPYPPAKATFTHDGTSADTLILSNGLVIIGVDEDKAPLTITATSAFDDVITDTVILTLV